MNQVVGCMSLDCLDGLQVRHVEHDSCGHLALIEGAVEVKLVFPLVPW